jgi:hypothetical protein
LVGSLIVPVVALEERLLRRVGWHPLESG